MAQTHFISVEIVLYTDHDPDEWNAWFEKQDNHVTRNQGDETKWHVFFAPLPYQDADTTIRNLCNEIVKLPEEIKRHWTNAVRREFFIGYQAGSEWPSFEDQVSLCTLQSVVNLKAEIRLVIYPASDD